MPEQKMDELLSLEEATNFWVHAVVITGIVMFVLIILLLLIRKKAKGNTFLIVGLNDAGKTVLYTKLINPQCDFDTYTSLKENIYEEFLSSSGKKYRLVDYPGAERLRIDLYSTWLHQQRQSLKGIIFVIDSSTFHRRVRDVAELLYDVIFESGGRVPVLVACNKQDSALAKSCRVIESALEREFGLINKSRSAALSSISNESTKRVLSESNEEFKWSELKNLKLDFIECSCEKDSEMFDVEPVQEFIDLV